MVVYFIMNQQGINDSWEGVDPTKIVLFENIHDIPFYNLNIVLIDDFYDSKNPNFVMNTLKNKIDNNIKNQYPHYYIEFNEQQVLDECNKYFVSNKNGVTKVLDIPAINDTIETKTCSIEYYKKLWDGKEQSHTIKNKKGEVIVKHLVNESKIFDQAFEPVTKNNKSTPTLFIHSVENTDDKSETDDKNSTSSLDSFSNNNKVSTILKFISGHVKKADYNNMKKEEFNYTDEEIIIKSMLIEFLEETPIIFNILYYLYKTTTNEKVYSLLSNLVTCYTNKNETKQNGNTNPYKVICKFDYNPTIKKDSEDKDEDNTVSKLIDNIYSYLTKNNEYKYKICRVKQHCLYNDYITLRINDIVDAIISSCITDIDDNTMSNYATAVKEDMIKDDICKEMNISEKCKKYVLDANNTVDNYKRYCYSMFVLAKTRFKINSEGNGELVGIGNSKSTVTYDSNSPYYSIAEKLSAWSPNIELSCVRCEDFNNCEEEKICINNDSDQRNNNSFDNPSAKRSYDSRKKRSDSITFVDFNDKRRAYSSNDRRNYRFDSRFNYNSNYRNRNNRGHGYGAYDGAYGATDCKNGRVCKYKTCDLKTIDGETISVDIFHMASVNLFYDNYTFLQSEMKEDNGGATDTILIYDTLNKYYSNLYRCVENNKQ